MAADPTHRPIAGCNDSRTRGVMRHYDESAEAGWQERPQRGGRRSARGHRRSPLMLASSILAAVVAVSLVGGSLYAYAKYRSVWDSIKRVDVSGDLNGIKQPPVDPHAINILLIGSDTRSGVNGKIGGRAAGQRSDTVMVLHVAPGAHRAVVLSFPRDSVVPVYSCTPEAGSPGQTEDLGQVEQINATFADGGPGCLMKTIIEQTHIHINDFVELTFIGFEKVINDLGGVNVCLPAAVDDQASGLKLSAGRHHIYGGQALAFWRTRENLGEGSDLQRIQRDQFLMASLLQGIEKSGLLTSTSKLTSVIGDVASHMTTDKDLDQSRMLTIAQSTKGLSSKSVQFIEVPTQTYPQNTNWVQFTPQAPQLFAAIAHDTKLPKTKKKPTATLTAVKPAQVSVEVLNGSGINLQAAAGANDLSERGFNVTGTGPADNINYTASVVEYATAKDKPAAELVKKQVSEVEILRNPSLTPGTVELILGSSFTALKAPSATSTSNLTQTFGGITGSTKICKDHSAFSGPDGE
jgi:LCP family protein required for cell wall assembly